MAGLTLLFAVLRKELALQLLLALALVEYGRGATSLLAFMTPQQIFWQERYRRQQENSYTRDRFTNIQRALSNVQGDIQKIGQLAVAIPDSRADGEQSLRKSLEVIAAHLNVIAGQNTQLLAILAEEGAARSASALSERTIGEARDLNEFNRRQQEQARIRQRYQGLADAARQRWNSF